MFRMQQHALRIVDATGLFCILMGWLTRILIASAGGNVTEATTGCKHWSLTTSLWRSLIGPASYIFQDQIC